MNMKRLLSLVAFFATLQASAQQVNPVPDYVFRNQMSVGRNAVTDTAAYFSIGPRYGANKGFMPPIVGDTATFSSGKRNGLLIFSVQKNKFLYWDSVGAKWSEMAGTAGTALTSADTAALLSTRAWRQKGIDSLATIRIAGSGTSNYIPKFTASTTIGNSKIFDNGTNIGVNTTSPAAPFQIGNANYYPSNDPVFLVSRNVNDDGGLSGTNGHSISEASIITRSGNIAFAGIENRAKFSGTNNYDHYAGFQNGLNYRSTGTMTNYFGYYDQLAVDSGTITNAYGIYLADAQKAAGATLTNNYGIYFADRTSGGTDWTIYSNSTAYTYLKGQMNVSKIITNETNTLATPSAEIEIQTQSGSKADLRLYQLGNNYWDIQIPANQTYLTIGDISNTYMWLKNGGEINIGSVTDAGDYKLQLTGNFYNTGSLTTGAPSGGSIKPWKIGEASTVSPTSPNRTLRVEVDGVVYYIHAKTTND